MYNVRCRCSYWYHNACLGRVENQSKCPMCRADVGPLYSAEAESLAIAVASSAPPATRSALTRPPRPAAIAAATSATPLVSAAATPSRKIQRLIGAILVAACLVAIMVVFIKFIAEPSWSGDS